MDIRIQEEFNDRSKFVYICDATYETAFAFYSLYYEITPGKFWEITFSFERGNIICVSDYTTLVVPQLKLQYYNHATIRAFLEKLPVEEEHGI